MTPVVIGGPASVRFWEDELKPRRTLATVFALAAVAWAARASADEPRRLRASLSYEAPAGCPAERAFRGQLARHSEIAIDEQASTSVVVVIERTGKKFRGRVGIGGRADLGEREVVAERCEDVVRGLALFSAIALDAFFDRDAPDPAVAPPPPPPSSAPPAPLPVDSAGVRRSAAQVVIASPPRSVLSLGLVVGEQQGPGPLVTTLGVRGQLALIGAAGSSFGLGVHVGQDFPRSYGEGTLTFRLGFARLDACPWSLRVARASITACVLGDLGVQRAALESAPDGRAQVEPWAALGGVLRLRVAAGDRWELQLSAGALRPLLPLDFSTRRSGIVYSTPDVAALFELGVTVPLR